VGDKFYFITKGEVEVVKETDEGEVDLARLSSGQYFGEIELLYDRPRMTTFRAARDKEHEVEVIAIGKAAFNKLRTMSDEPGEDFMRTADSRRLATKMVDFGFMPDED
jgi:CRP-like cAMP-binding protein